MRLAFALTLLAGLVALADDDVPQIVPREPEPRFGIQAKLKVYPQATPKKALESALEASERGDYSYLVAHLLDPAFVELRIADRARESEAAVELNLLRQRDFQYANPDRFLPADRLPLDKQRFAAAVLEKSRERAFKQLQVDVGQKLRDDPQTIKDLKKILRDGTFADEGAAVKAEHPTVKNRTLYFKRIGDRWFLENREGEIQKKEPQ
jgi:hypothetical protein